MAPTNIVIIGASFAGIPIAHSLIKDVPSAKVTLINPSSTFYFPVAAPRILAKPAAFREEQYLISIQDAFKHYSGKSFEFVLGRATSINVEGKTVTIDDDKTISFDYLVIASGSTTASTITQNGTPFPFKQSGSDNMSALIGDAQNAISRAKRIVIGGAGPIGVELAGEIAEAAEERGKEVSITLVSASARVLPILKPSGSDAAEWLLTQKNVEILKSSKVTAATQADDSTWTVTLDNERQLEADIYIPTTGALPNNTFIPKELLDESGWVNVDSSLRVQSETSQSLPIYAAGDITNNSMRLSFKATEQAAVVAANLKADILGSGKRRSYDQGNCIMMLVPVGASGGTGQLFGFTPFSMLVRLVKGRDFFISKALEAVAAK
ncbi:hypothetical protein ASPWEDRAFT_41374 [Aspergillus wentii DTO 134E9]|uniref:FAD/NAD(P)-binding domain-containing protein n=1 Tax=Aspergillus wentii DTO 134E9 TaxID=1073089 RepID=A0A1L9RML4_ASPWE|nr:uncharacterized protein ASPWEDRAFT_41374 [Aspergillus wentii DTO 134E9]KAI9929413.1 hypothetical protein MW887_000883 [Aspergillus wentii]OJJ36144.1 hypothetical protein ASPWEDRAFT_41374 [Aspergillus wentii DTO 134E9]